MERPLWGVHVPQMHTDAARMTELAQGADEAGIDGFWLMDHLAAPGVPQLDALEAWTLLAALAASTSRVRLGLLVGCNPFRHPSVLAKMAATVDRISNGRLDLGIGWGSIEDELNAYGFGGKSRKVRAEELDETLQILDLMFTGETFDYDGRHFQLQGAIGRPTPVQDRIPVHIGGAGKQLTLPLVAKHADWWNCVGNAKHRLDELAPLRGTARLSVQYACGFVRSEAEREKVTGVTQHRLPVSGWGEQLIGNAEELVEKLNTERKKGIEMFVLRFHDYRDPTIFRDFMQQVAPHVA